MSLAAELPLWVAEQQALGTMLAAPVQDANEEEETVVAVVAQRLKEMDARFNEGETMQA